MAYATHTLTAPGDHRFRIVLGRSTYSVALYQGKRRIWWSGRHWGPSLTDALMMACYTGDWRRASSAIRYLTGDASIVSLWERSRLDGLPESTVRAVVIPIQRLAIGLCGPAWLQRRMRYSHPY